MDSYRLFDKDPFLLGLPRTADAQALAQVYDSGAWLSASGGGVNNRTPFRNAGVLVLALEDNSPYLQKHTTEDVPEIIR